MELERKLDLLLNRLDNLEQAVLKQSDFKSGYLKITKACKQWDIDARTFWEYYDSGMINKSLIHMIKGVRRTARIKKSDMHRIFGEFEG
jgi:hypothetical protein